MNQPGWAPLPLPPAPPPAPYFAGPPAPPQKPSGGYKALGIVQATLGAAGTLWALASIAISLFVTSKVSGLYAPAVLALMYGRTATNLLTGVLLVVTGVGVFRAKRWSRWVGVGYAAISLGEVLLGTALSFLVAMPRSPGMGSSGGIQTFVYATTIVSMLAYSVLPTVTLVALLRKRAGEELDQ